MKLPSLKALSPNSKPTKATKPTKPTKSAEHQSYYPSTTMNLIAKTKETLKMPPDFLSINMVQ